VEATALGLVEAGTAKQTRTPCTRLHLASYRLTGGQSVQAPDLSTAIHYRLTPAGREAVDEAALLWRDASANGELRPGMTRSDHKTAADAH
jgi:hypothetical protein